MEANNMATMREALKQASYFLNKHHMGAVYAPDGETLICCWDVAKVVGDALAAPPRNCDVGTAEEQAERFEAECHRHDHCTPCSVHREWGEFKEGKPKSCQLIWAQMRYEAKEGGAE